MSILDLFKNLKLIVTVLVILGLGAFAYIQHGQVDSAREESKTAKMERDAARADRFAMTSAGRPSPPRCR